MPSGGNLHQHRGACTTNDLPVNVSTVGALAEESLYTSGSCLLRSCLALAYAVAKMGLVSRNVSEMLKPPKRGHREMMPLSVIEVRRFLDAVQGDRFEALYILALSTGMREGELLGLRWQDVDLARRIVQVRMNVQETSGRYILAETKTAYSRRTVALTQAAVDALAAHWQMQQVEKASMGTGTTMRSTWYSPTASAAS